ncbi:hypothetical protein HAZT_HAZT007781 [Hyalella azteca]|uniref:Uncharacterized protein n=1 Tax=Hyalella azteca TaxID=294128 RepID=A0A6A0H1Z8_HYAAZ|nr:hypothetical protein HAZT_HAZT007781 [Hyalella azteca]
MAGPNVGDFTFKKDTVVTIDSKSCAKVDKQSVPVNSQLLCQRLLTVARENSENLSDVIKYELCNQPSALFTTKKEQFLTNASNKQEFVNMLSQKLVSAGCHVLQAEGDADVLIAKTAVEYANECSNTVIGEDTDLITLLIFSTNPDSEALYLQSDKKKGKKFRVWDIHWFQRSVGPEVCTLLPFVHAIAGCDTTSPLVLWNSDLAWGEPEL